MWKPLSELENYGKPLATPTKAQVNELAHYVKVKYLTDLIIVDPLAKSSDLVGDFVKALNAKEKQRKGKRQFIAKCFKVKDTVRKGKTKEPVHFDPLLEEHAERYKPKGINYIFAAPPSTMSDFFFPFFIDRASEFCAMFAPKTWVESSLEHRKLLAESWMPSAKDNVFYKLDCGDNCWFIVTSCDWAACSEGSSYGGVGKPGLGARRRRTVRTMEGLTREVGGAEEADIARAGSGQAEGLAQEEQQEPGPQRDCWGLGAGVLGRRVRVQWPAEGASFDGVVHAWVPGEGRHVVRYDDGDEVSHDLCEEQVEWLAGESGQRAQVAAATVGVPDVAEPEVVYSANSGLTRRTTLLRRVTNT
ncbi:hypothetical protein CYMTET_54517 [Cymbomonas tetramitiformis]|uniref:Uncharacterized protein n=1 Tax=Cymbomonas tetramitiformis TaxID=36881 RepID=A0AAE0EQM8_9CHLO|nr:hypothetical protein CYMTET_54517 [Cymbomonas tetramitiformis]